jgi:hypothetical protein
MLAGTLVALISGLRVRGIHLDRHQRPSAIHGDLGLSPKP